MTRVPAETFLSWAAGLGVIPDERYASPRCLIYRDERSHSRFWNLPREPDELRTLLAHVLCGLEAWDSCYVWPRGGCWHSSQPPRSRIEEERALALYGGHIPDGLRGAVCYSTQEAPHLINLIDARSRAAFCVSDDLFVVPDHATAFLHMDHHDVVHVECSDAMRMERFIHHMASGGYALPDELPDVTFKRPEWMK